MANKIFFRSNIELKPISIKYNNQEERYSDIWADDIGTNVFLYMHNKEAEKGGLIIENSYIIKMKIHNNGFIPILELNFKDPSGIIGSKLHPDDDSIISFFKSSQSKILMPIRIDFVIDKFKMVKDRIDSNDRIFSLIAHLNFNNIAVNKAYKGTSFSILQNIAKESLLGFVSNINDTDDNMTWINPGNYTSEFIQEITKYSYKDDNSFLISFIDLYYNLNFVDIEKQLKDDTFEQKNIYPLQKTFDFIDDSTTRLLITNHPNMASTNMFITSYLVNNTARDTNWNIGYKSKINFYDKLSNSTEVKIIDTFTNNDNNKILFKSLNPDENIRKFSMGKQDIDNVHPNFLLSKKQNINNIEFFQIVQMNIILQSANMNIYRMQHIEVIIYELDSVIKMDPDDNKTDSYRINEKLSGSWLVTGVSFIYNRNSFSQEITLVRKDINIEYDKEKLDEITKYFYKYKN